MKFSIGSDPEFILIDENYRPKSSIGILQSKTSSFNKIYYDNVLAEVQVKPSFKKECFVKNIKHSLNELSNKIKPFRISTSSFCNFPIAELEHKDSFKFGCESEYCAYELERIQKNNIKKLFKESNMRFAGGHIHIGTEIKGQENQIMLVRMLDLFLGLPLILIDNSKGCEERRFYFGNFGRYRKKKYGIEYRTPSNFWIFNQETIGLVYDIIDFVIKFCQKQKHFDFWEVDYDKLNSDDFWNHGGDPSQCHKCFGYNINSLREIRNKKQLKENFKLIEILENHMPIDILEKIKGIEKKELLGTTFHMNRF